MLNHWLAALCIGVTIATLSHAVLPNASSPRSFPCLMIMATDPCCYRTVVTVPL